MYSKTTFFKSLYLLFSLFILFVIELSFINKYVEAENNETTIEIENPIFTTKGVNERPYTIKAASGIQKGDVLELFKIEGKIKNHNEIWIYLNAEKGNYDQIAGMILLFDNVEVYTDNQETLISDKAIIDINKDQITLLSNVEYQSENSRIKADKSTIKNSFQNFEYFGNVKTKINYY
tara:strand:- start:1270 stop:1803 length:534 start_codon:yes stop_codon:yes gene_type:complete